MRTADVANQFDYIVQSCACLRQYALEVGHNEFALRLKIVRAQYFSSLVPGHLPGAVNYLVRSFDDDRMRIVTEGRMNAFRSVVRDFRHLKDPRWTMKCLMVCGSET